MNIIRTLGILVTWAFIVSATGESQFPSETDYVTVKSENNNNAKSSSSQDSSTSIVSKGNLFTIEGKIKAPTDLMLTPEFLTTFRIIVNQGEFLGFPKEDGSFSVTNLPPGSYLVEVTHPDYFYEPVRVDITSKGKIRARKVNYIKPSEVREMDYPLKFKARSAYRYFHVRETWRVTDFLFNPMVIMMVLPLIFMVVLPKMINAADPETQREMQNMQMPKYDMPELSEMMTSLFKSGANPGGSAGGPNAVAGSSRGPPKISMKKKS